MCISFSKIPPFFSFFFFDASQVTVNAMVIFAVSHRNENATHLEAESLRAPVSSEKLVSDRSPPIVAVFKGKAERPRPALDRSFTRSAEFGTAKTGGSTLSVTGVNNLSYSSDLYDYLPKDQLPQMESQIKGAVSASERSESSLCVSQPFASRDVVDREQTSATIAGSSGASLGHDRRKGSRGLISEFRDRIGRSRSGVDDMSIQVLFSALSLPLLCMLTIPAGHHYHRAYSRY